MKYKVQEFMVSNEEQMGNLEEWSNHLEERLSHMKRNFEDGWKKNWKSRKIQKKRYEMGG